MPRVYYDPLVIGLVFLLLVSGCGQTSHAPTLELKLAPGQMTWIGEQIFRNECAGKPACLVHWNQGEGFPSLGIGHFIWYPYGAEGPFTESFPALMTFLHSQGVQSPPWLAGLEPFDAPWPDRETFLEESDSGRVLELRDFLADTKAEQAAFLLQRARLALGGIVAAAPESDQVPMLQSVKALAATPGGVYALIDYVNFKGEGVAPTERYNGEGWGLLQVLQQMDDGKPPLQAFRESAGRVLTRRAENALQPLERERWLAGWLNRLATYREPERSPAGDKGVNKSD